MAKGIKLRLSGILGRFLSKQKDTMCGNVVKSAWAMYGVLGAAMLIKFEIPGLVKIYQKTIYASRVSRGCLRKTFRNYRR